MKDIAVCFRKKRDTAVQAITIMRSVVPGPCMLHAMTYLPVVLIPSVQPLHPRTDQKQCPPFFCIFLNHLLVLLKTPALKCTFRAVVFFIYL